MLRDLTGSLNIFSYAFFQLIFGIGCGIVRQYVYSGEEICRYVSLCSSGVVLSNHSIKRLADVSVSRVNDLI